MHIIFLKNPKIIDCIDNEIIKFYKNIIMKLIYNKKSVLV